MDDLLVGYNQLYVLDSFDEKEIDKAFDDYKAQAKRILLSGKNVWVKLTFDLHDEIEKGNK